MREQRPWRWGRRTCCGGEGMAQPWGQGWEQLARGCGRQERCRAGSYAEMVLEVRKRMYPIHLKHAPQGNLGCNIVTDWWRESSLLCAPEMYKDGSQMDLRRKKGDTVTIIVPPAKDLGRQHPSLYGALSFFFFFNETETINRNHSDCQDFTYTKSNMLVLHTISFGPLKD